MTEVRIYTDGSGTTGGPAGIAYVAVIGEFVVESSLSLRNATNQQAEILAAAYALHEVDPVPMVTVVSDSEYVVKGFNEWLAAWMNRGWRTASGSPVKNQAHWKRLIVAASRHGEVVFEWCRGHNGEQWNERADELAGMARMEAMSDG